MFGEGKAGNGEGGREGIGSEGNEFKGEMKFKVQFLFTPHSDEEREKKPQKPPPQPIIPSAPFGAGNGSGSLQENGNGGADSSLMGFFFGENLVELDFFLLFFGVVVFPFGSSRVWKSGSLGDANSRFFLGFFSRNFVREKGKSGWSGEWGKLLRLWGIL